MTIIEQYSIPEPNSGCWIWFRGKPHKEGYGWYKRQLAHRLSHEIYKGPIPFKLDIDHLCRNTGCVNPDHLEAVPHALNNQRAFPKYCKHGHLLEGDNLIPNRRSKYQRRCKQCNRERQARYRG